MPGMVRSLLPWFVRLVSAIAVTSAFAFAFAGCTDDLTGDDAGLLQELGASHPDLSFVPPNDLAGVPASDANTGPDAAMPACQEAPFSTFGGVSLRFVSPRCRFTLAEAAAGLDFQYELIVDKDVPGVIPISGDNNHCEGPDPSGLSLFARVSGGNESWCRCDVGRCQPAPMIVGSIVGGRYPYKLRWAGRNWSGPSDFGQMEGAAFPAGTYDVLVAASGTYMAGAQMLPFTVRDVLTIKLAP